MTNQKKKEQKKNISSIYTDWRLKQWYDQQIFMIFVMHPINSIMSILLHYELFITRYIYEYFIYETGFQ